MWVREEPSISLKELSELHCDFNDRGERFSVSKRRTHPFFLSSFVLHAGILLSSVAWAYLSHIDINVETKKSPTPTIEASLWQAPVEKPSPPVSFESVVKKVPEGSKSSQKEQPPTEEFMPAEDARSRKLLARAKFDDLLAGTEGKIIEDMVPLRPSDISDIQEKWKHESVELIEEPGPDLNGKTLLQQPIEEKTVKHDVKSEEDWSFDPLLVYQKKIADMLFSYLRYDNKKSTACVLGLRLTRDGLVLESYWVSGDKELCQAGKKAARRAGKLPMPAEPGLYKYLNHLEITLINGTDFT
jgi:hypothetical protein